jgi:hypothetical protein
VGCSVLRRSDAARCKAFQIHASAKYAALTPKHGNIDCIVGIKAKKGILERIGMLRIYGVADLGARLDDRQHPAIAFDTYCHDECSSGVWVGSDSPVRAPMKESWSTRRNTIEQKVVARTKPGW